MKGHRYKPVGWRNESQRHYLAAKGIKTKPRRYMAYNPAFVAGDLPVIAADGIGTAGAAVVPLIPLLVPVALAYGGAKILSDRKKKNGTFFAEKDGLSALSATEASFFLSPEDFDNFERQQKEEQETFEMNLAGSVLRDISMFGAPRPTPLTFAKKDQAFVRVQEGEAAEFDARPIRTKGKGSQTDFRFVGQTTAIPAASLQEKQDRFKIFPDKDEQFVDIKSLDRGEPTTGQLQGEFLRNKMQLESVQGFLNKIDEKERKTSAFHNEQLALLQRQKEIKKELRQGGVDRADADEAVLKKAQEANQKVFG